ncbi:DNA-3-methyladenine glycosylase I [Lactobacillus xylocopicola]|uniref:3-methyladenine DNA glycosylase n=1 Tax=Lactobacillus xylocopicola TaxID=2976676 RepID=A0ABN6SP45_9LACO|nr:DNA-3-methyladenine glycosylase I [Lactobacillus xylocopicola]BDR61116.1 3-methyladenine DNA glycosylase [Lactobacillus xylocopicola]
MTLSTRCSWSKPNDPLVEAYHDHEWGKLNLNEQYLYEMLVLESFQSGLSWTTILHKRENLRTAFRQFKPAGVAQMADPDVNRLMQDASIIRNRRKIVAAIQNARAILTIAAKHGSFASYLQDFIKKPIINHPQTATEVATTSPIAQKLAKQMKQDGFTFVGPVVIYSFLEAIGLINDHLESCSFKYTNKE